MRWPRIIVLLIVLSFLGAFLHYTLPQRDIVRVVRAEVILTEVDGWNRWFFASADSGASGSAISRDVRYINTVYPGENGPVMVFRNEDTGIFWPPYFKFDSQDLQAEATNLESEAADPQWVVITHYGWRNNFLSIYPNALEIRPVESADVRLIPWMPIVILVVMGLILFMIWRIWERFEDRVIAPIVDGAAVRWAKLKDRVSGRG